MTEHPTEVADDLISGDLTVTGRVMPASNGTFVGTIGRIEVVYKPVSGEKPLWDFPDGTLAGREVAAYLVATVLDEVWGAELVPPTWWREGPFGPGMVQRWCESDPDDAAVTIVPAGQVPDGWLHVFDGFDGENRRVSLIHEDTPDLRRLAVFDVVANNADRKGGHVLELPGGARRGIDHGLTFHVEPKLRTVLWGWIDQPLASDELAAVRHLRAAIDADLAKALADLIHESEIEALAERCDRLVAHGTFPAPTGDMPAVPWPPF